jgi:deoxyribose-phosphate aldolase
MDAFSSLNDLSGDQVLQRCHEFLKKGIPGQDKNELHDHLISLIDLTTLEGTDNSGSIARICQKALDLALKGLPLPAAVCVYPPFIRLARELLKGTGISIASVAGAFPSGQSPLPIRISEVRYALDEGAEEIDMVISRGRFLERDYSYIYDEVSAFREVSQEFLLKVIIETGELKSYEQIRKASEIVISAGADFIKTSTGKITPAATETAALVMLEVIRDEYLKSGKKIGFKAAGGISEPEQAIHYYTLVYHQAGKPWLHKAFFRIGASRLLDNLVLKMNR